MNGFIRRLISIPILDETAGPTRSYILIRDGHMCCYCGLVINEDNGNRDHVIPRIAGGTDEPSNLVASCIRCNSSKGRLSPVHWLELQRRTERGWKRLACPDMTKEYWESWKEPYSIGALPTPVEAKTANTPKKLVSKPKKKKHSEVKNPMAKWSRAYMG